MLLFICICSAQPSKNIKNVSEVYKHLRAIITQDSNSICISCGGKVLNRYTTPSGYYLSTLHYDRIADFISFNQCRAIDYTTQYAYELIVWDYVNNKTWLLGCGTSQNDGEGTNSSYVCNYCPPQRSGFMITYGWESRNVIIFPGEQPSSRIDLPGGTKDLLAIINDDSLLIQLSDEAMNTSPFYLCCLGNDTNIELDSIDVLDYNDLMLSQFGRNVQYYYKPSKEINFFNSDWNADGTTVIYENLNWDTNKHEYYFYDKKNNYRELVSVGERVIPIWK
jgi:hypothetical protein